MAGQSRGLGRGLDALLGGGRGEIAGRPEGAEVRMLPVNVVRPNPKQPRTVFSGAALEDLAESIRTQGVLQPILVRPKRGMDGQRYEIVAGERRWRASQMAELAEIPALVRELSGEESLALALIENLQREDLNPLEEAKGLKELQERLGVNQEGLAKHIGKSRPAVANMLRLLQLPEAMQRDLGEGRITAGHGRALVGVTDDGVRVELCRRTQAEHLSVRQVEALAAHFREHGALPGQNQPVRRKPAQTCEPDTRLVASARDLSARFGVPVRISGDGGKGRITLSYASAEELNTLLKNLGAGS